MAGRIIYLEVDDEITSAASRIRDAQAPRIAVVLPYGSRVATSRINFRLLSRDALTHDKRLSIVSGDAATRALAASAGLPVFASVSEYESSLEGIEDAPSGPAGPPVAAAVGGALATPERGTASQPMGSAGSDGTLGLVVPAAAAGAAMGGAAAVVPPGDTIRTSVPRDMPAPVAAGGGAAGVAAGARRGGRSRTPWLIGGAILALAVLVAGVGVYLLLPSAAIAVTPHQEPVGPVDVTVTADTTATAPDATALVVPAQQVPVPVSVTNTFNATGKRVAVTNATGSA